MLGLAVAVVLGIAGNAEPASAPPPNVTITVAPGVVVLPLGARGPLGFKFGPVDGVMGGVKEGPNQYRFFGSGESLNTSACPGTPGVQGAFAFTSSLSTSPPSFTSDCKALVQPSGPLVETGIVGAYDRNYLGGGPAMRVTHPDGRRGVLLVYHSEVQWYDDGPCATGTTLCFYGTLGMAFSSDDGATFQKLGLIIQAHISRATFHTPPFLGGNVPIGNGPFVLGDASGNAVDPRTADPSQTYIYVFYVDNQEDLGAADPCAPSKACLAVARAPLSAVIEAAFAGDGVTLTGLFRKYFNGGFEEPAAPPDPNGTLPTNNAGRYTPVLKNAFSPSAVYDATAGQVILATVASAQIQLRVSQNLLDWSQPAVATLAEAAPFAEVRYPSLIGELDDANVAGGAPWLFYSREPPDGTWPQTEFMTKRIQLTLTTQLPITRAVMGFYQNVLEREPEPAGLAGWSDFLRANCTAQGFEAIAQGFFDSLEFRTEKPHSLERLVTLLYRTFLGREPDPGGLAGWAGLIRQARLTMALQGFIPSGEFQGLLPDRTNRAAVTAVVTRLYQQVLGRAPDPAGLQGWVDFIIATGNLEAVATGFLASQESEGRSQTFRDYVTTLYRTFLERDPEPAGLDAWESVLRNTLLQVINSGFVPSQEFQGLLPQVCG